VQPGQQQASPTVGAGNQNQNLNPSGAANRPAEMPNC
jgi:hypothetical protein